MLAIITIIALTAILMELDNRRIEKGAFREERSQNESGGTLVGRKQRRCARSHQCRLCRCLDEQQARESATESANVEGAAC